jgi:hypothetical protein
MSPQDDWAQMSASSFQRREIAERVRQLAGLILLFLRCVSPQA